MLTKNKLDNISKLVYKGKALSSTQIDTLNLLSDSFKDHGGNSDNQLAYIFATVYHEVGSALKPVREGFKSSDKDAIAHVTKMFDKKQIKTNYALPGSNGKSFYGRGYVQITWEDNYKKLGKAIGVDLFNDPDKALEPKVAAEIAVYGMIKGVFTGKKLSDYITDSKTDYVGARRIINGSDRAAMIAEYADNFKLALSS